MTDREKLLKQIAESDFAITDLHLFLNTHPNNETVAKKIEEYRTKSNLLKKEYEERFGPLQSTSENGNRWAWIANPWPWDATKEDC